MRPGDEYLPRAVSRLEEEMGINVKQGDLRVVYRFSYEAPDVVNSGWCENELDTVIVGEWNGVVNVNQDEAADYRWLEWGELNEDIKKNHAQYAPWYKMIVGDKRLVENVC
jgi:isopentenyl-diphosphate delta-isomerase